MPVITKKYQLSNGVMSDVGADSIVKVCGIVMYFSTPFLIVEITMSHPPCTPTAKL